LAVALVGPRIRQADTLDSAAGTANMTAKRYATYTRKKPVAFSGGKWTTELVVTTVEVMATAKGYAMVRHKGCMPFVVSEKELRAIT
jgi:hypothetical protein